MKQPQPFPWFLAFVLAVSPVAIAAGYVFEQLDSGTRNPLFAVLTFACWGPGVLGSLIAGPIAMYKLWRERPRYSTRWNYVLVFLNALPLLVLIALPVSLMFKPMHL